MEMSMRGSEDIEIGEEITPAIPALCYSLSDSFLFSHCSSCFSPLKHPSHSSSSSSSSSCCQCQNPILYCSPPSPCSLSSSSSSSSADSHLLHLLHSHPSLYPHSDSSDLRLALSLLHRLSPLSLPAHRIAGILTNRRKIMTDGGEVAARIRDGARAMAAARRMRDGFDLSCCVEALWRDDVVFEEEEEALCLVITNAVEVQDKSGRTLGLALFFPSFCWINHSCSPNACYRTLLSADHETPPSYAVRGKPMRIKPHSYGDCEDNQAVRHLLFS